MSKFSAIMLAAAMLPALFAQAVQAKDGWHTSTIRYIFVSTEGSIRVRFNSNPDDDGFSCNGAAYFGSHENDADRIRYEHLAEALTTNARVGVYLEDETSSSGNQYCNIQRLQRHAPAASTTNPPPVTPPPVTPPPVTPPPTRDYYGAFALSDENAPGVWKYGLSSDQSTLALASSVALEACRERLTASGDFCTVRGRFVTGECMVLYTGNEGFVLTASSGPRDRLAQVRQRALELCRSDASGCREEATVCNSGTYSGIAPQSIPGSTMMKQHK